MRLGTGAATAGGVFGPGGAVTVARGGEQPRAHGNRDYGGIVRAMEARARRGDAERVEVGLVHACDKAGATSCGVRGRGGAGRGTPAPRQGWVEVVGPVEVMSVDSAGSDTHTR
jgi:hypothetical protein